MDATLTSGIKTRILMISDTHTLGPNPPTNTSTPYRHPLPKADILLHAGDITRIGRKAEHEAMLSMLKAADAELKIVIAGNHDITLDSDYYNRHGRRMHQQPSFSSSSSSSSSSTTTSTDSSGLENPTEIKSLYTSPDVLAHNIIYMDEGLRTFTLPSTGAQFSLYASPYTPEYCNWAFAYPRHIDRFNPSSSSSPPPSNPVPDFPGVDIMLTHGPPSGILDKVVHGEHVGCENLLRACVRARPRVHVFGHIHEGYGACRVDWGAGQTTMIAVDAETVLEERCAYLDATSSAPYPLRVGEETLFVNASVVDVRYSPRNAPWVVDLDLPGGGSL